MMDQAGSSWLDGGISTVSGGSSNLGSSVVASRAPNALKEALDEQVRAKQQRKERNRALKTRYEAGMLEADRHELRVFRQLEHESRQAQKESLAAAWREDMELRELQKVVNG